jgi:cytochrome-b5 reductase
MKYSNLVKTTFTTMAASSYATPDRSDCLPPETKQTYRVLERRSVSPDSCVLKFALPPGRAYLGWEADIPTCISVSYDGTDENGEPKTLAKSYSPISHPATPETFDLLVKGYEPRPGGGVGAYLCGLQAGDEIIGKLKSQRIMHGSPVVARRWKHVGLVAGGTGIAPLFQIVKILLDDPEDNAKIYLLSINRYEHDVLLKDELDEMAKIYPDRIRVTYQLTGNNAEEGYDHGRYGVDLAIKALPPPSSADTMILVCGKNGFVSFWGGPIGRAPRAPDGSKGPKIQGPLLGVLKEVGYDESQVFKY